MCELTLAFLTVFLRFFPVGFLSLPDVVLWFLCTAFFLFSLPFSSYYYFQHFLTRIVFFYCIQLKGTFFERITAQFEVSLYFYTKLINLSVRQEWTRRKLFLITNFFKKIFNIQIPQVNGFKYYIFAFSYTN